MNQPAHYAGMATEPVDLWRDTFKPDALAAVFRALVLKHAMRAGLKGPTLEDARKTRQYAEWWVQALEAEQEPDLYRVEYQSPVDGWVLVEGELSMEDAKRSLKSTARLHGNPVERYRIVPDGDQAEPEPEPADDDPPLLPRGKIVRIGKITWAKPETPPEPADDGKRYRVEWDWDSRGTWRLAVPPQRFGVIGLSHDQALAAIEERKEQWPSFVHRWRIVEDTP